MALAKLPKPETYHGIPTLTMSVDDPIPQPRAPTRYAVWITPDLARYFLTFNHPDNRALRQRKVTQMAADMTEGRWHFTPESIVFSDTGVLQNGQNRLMAVTEYGSPVCMMVDFGWPDDIIAVIDRGSARTNQDALKVSGITNSATIAAIVTKVWQYARTVGETRSWSGMAVPSSTESVAIAMSQPDAWLAADHAGHRLYRALDRGAGPGMWGACYFIIAREHPETVVQFFEEIAEGSGAKGSPTRVLADWFRRRPITATKTGDSREPVELVIRGFNAWSTGRSLSFIKYKGFTLSAVRPV